MGCLRSPALQLHSRGLGDRKSCPGVTRLPLRWPGRQRRTLLLTTRQDGVQGCVDRRFPKEAGRVARTRQGEMQCRFSDLNSILPKFMTTWTSESGNRVFADVEHTGLEMRSYGTRAGPDPVRVSLQETEKNPYRCGGKTSRDGGDSAASQGHQEPPMRSWRRQELWAGEPRSADSWSRSALQDCDGMHFHRLKRQICGRLLWPP